MKQLCSKIYLPSRELPCNINSGWPVSIVSVTESAGLTLLYPFRIEIVPSGKLVNAGQSRQKMSYFPYFPFVPPSVFSSYVCLKLISQALYQETKWTVSEVWKKFFASSPGLPWQHGRRQLSVHQFPNLTKQLILSLGIILASAGALEQWISWSIIWQDATLSWEPMMPQLWLGRRVIAK